VLRERQGTRVRYEVPRKNVNGNAVGVGVVEGEGGEVGNENGNEHQNQMRTLSMLFGLFEANRVALFVEEYSVSQTSLEQIFNRFASQQEEKTGHAHGTMAAML